MRLWCIMRKSLNEKKLTAALSLQYDRRMLIAGLLFAQLVATRPSNVNVDDVLAMMSELPAVEGDIRVRVGHFEKRRDAREIASAIVNVAADPFEAKLMVVYAAYESGMKRDAIGDHGLSFGTWQLRGLSPELAFSPAVAAKVWVRRARQAAVDCSESAFEERLAPLASGNCDHARMKTRWRMELAERL